MSAGGLNYEFRDLGADLGGAPVLRGLNGSFRAGAVTALIGPNGSGKSTLLRVLGGFVPCRGALTLGGRELKSFTRRELGRLIGVVAQQARAQARFSVYNVIGFGRLPYQSLLGRAAPADTRAVLDAAGRLHVEHLLLRPVDELSGGEKQRVFLAMIVAQDAPVCLFDEPTSAMDPRQALDAFALMRELAAQGKTVVVAAHDINAALACADDFLALRGGRVAAVGRAAEVTGGVLRALYGVRFELYVSERGDKVWHPALSDC